MIASTQITDTEMFAFISALIFKLLNRSFVYEQKRQKKLLRSRLLFKQIANFTGILLQNYKQLECNIFRTFLKQVSDQLSVFFEFS